MSDLSTEQVKASLAEVVREGLQQGQSVEVPGFGTFRIRHEASSFEQQPDGQVLMKPPRDKVVFEPAPIKTSTV